MAAGDYYDDGFVDLYPARGTLGPNLLLHNLGNGRFEEIADHAAALPGSDVSGPTFADVDGDGDLDLLVPTWPRGIQLFLNDEGTLTPTTDILSPELAAEDAINATFGDLNQDRFPDLLLARWGSLSAPTSYLEHVWCNHRGTSLRRCEQPSGMLFDFLDFSGARFYVTFSPNFADINNDGLPDVLVTSDAGTSKVFDSIGHGSFVDHLEPAVTDENGMGAAIRDYDNDGDLDWFVTSIYDPDGPQPGWGASGNRLYRNRGDGTFEDATDEAGVRIGYRGWAACFADFNNDGWLDLFHVNGHYAPQPQFRDRFFGKPSLLYLGAPDGKFTEAAQPAGVDAADEGRGVACFDYDRDGHTDIFVANVMGPPRLFRNNTGQENHFLDVRLFSQRPNRLGIGARVEVQTSGLPTQTREIRSGTNDVSQDPAEAHFGLAAATSAEEIQVRWPDGRSTRLTNVVADRLIPIAERPGDGNCDGDVGAADAVRLALPLSDQSGYSVAQRQT